MTCTHCGLVSELVVCDLCYDRLTPLLQSLVTENSKGIEERVLRFFTYRDRLKALSA